MSFGIRLHVWGRNALFTRPEMKVERVSYDVMTPSAARGILEAIHWKPAIRWVIDRIHVLAGGRLVESGSHEALLAAGGHYARLYRLQSEREREGLAHARPA